MAYVRGATVPRERTSLADVRVLHLQGDPFAAALVHALLDDEGAAVVWARNAAVAVETVRSETFDVVLVDADRRTPLDDLLARLDAVVPDVPVVVASRAPVAAVPAGVELLTRPCSGRTLLAGIRRALAGAD